MPVVKANAYGHGIDLVVPALTDLTDIFAVANTEEALAVRKHAPEADVMILSPALEWEFPDIVEQNFIPAISSLEEAHSLARATGKRNVRIHLVVDTAMGRIGVWHEDALHLLHELQKVPGLELHSVSTHLPSADEDVEFTTGQLDNFSSFVQRARGLLGDAGVHVLNSAGCLRFPRHAADIVRAGLALYGVPPVPENAEELQPVLAWKTTVALVRDVPAGRTVSYGRTFTTERASRLATLAVGYADGYQRHLSGTAACVLLGGVRCRLVGRVTMDQIIVDVTDAGEICAGDVAVLIGQQGGEKITAAELAQRSKSIPWEILSGIGPRVKRLAVPQK